MLVKRPDSQVTCSVFTYPCNRHITNPPGWLATTWIIWRYESLQISVKVACKTTRTLRNNRKRQTRTKESNLVTLQSILKLPESSSLMTLTNDRFRKTNIPSLYNIADSLFLILRITIKKVNGHLINIHQNSTLPHF